MRIDNSALLTGSLSDQVSSKKEEEKLKSFSDTFEKAKDSGDADKLRKASEQFEAFFINEIFKTMRKSSDWGENLIEKSHARKNFESMHDEKLADEISSGQGIGISDMIFKQMSKRYGIGDEAIASEQVSQSDQDKDQKNDSEDRPAKLDIKG